MSEEQPYDLERFLRAQEGCYGNAIRELKAGHKCSCWMWFVFPQLRGLGQTSTAHFYGIDGIGEAKAYLRHHILGARLVEASNTLLELEDSDPVHVLGYTDALKLRSCMTLFMRIPSAPAVFSKVLDKYYGGNKDTRTLEMLGIVRVRYRLEGHVQGVGLRGTLSKRCMGRSVTGWMCNTPDPRLVIAELQGRREDIDYVIGMVQDDFCDPGRSRGMKLVCNKEMALVGDEKCMREIPWENVADKS